MIVTGTHGHALLGRTLRASLEALDGVPVRLVETHISWVLLTESLAYKLKKPVPLTFLDFTTLAARRRFPDGALWSEMLADGTLASRHIDALAQRLADVHRDAAVAPPCSVFGSAVSRERVTQGLIDAIAARQDETEASGSAIDWPALRAWLGQQQKALSPLSAARLRAGLVRECHGDLHLANVLQLAGEATAFDAIEFDAELRWIDMLDDIAFLAMDLLANGRRDLAFRFINAYLAASGDYDGRPALRYGMVCRVLVRARVTAGGEKQGMHSAARCGEQEYLALASALSCSADARLAITHGLPGSGKSFAAQGVVEAVGAIGVRSDVERKRLFGLGARQSSRGHVPGGIYDPAATQRSYARLRELATLALAAGWPVVVDAAFLLRSERAAPAACDAGAALAGSGLTGAPRPPPSRASGVSCSHFGWRCCRPLSGL